MNPNIPRDKVNWHPKINYDACTGDRACIDFCKNHAAYGSVSGEVEIHNAPTSSRRFSSSCEENPVCLIVGFCPGKKRAPHASERDHGVAG